MVGKENVLLVGDAAGFADNWTKEGIYYSIQSAICAADAIKKYFLGTGSLSEYKKMCKNRCYRNLRDSCLFDSLFRRFPHIYGGLKYEKVRDLFIPFVSGEISYRKAALEAAKEIVINKFFYGKKKKNQKN